MERGARLFEGFDEPVPLGFWVISLFSFFRGGFKKARPLGIGLGIGSIGFGFRSGSASELLRIL